MLLAHEAIITAAQRILFDRDAEHMDVDMPYSNFVINYFFLVTYDGRPPSKLHAQLRGPLRVVN